MSVLGILALVGGGIMLVVSAAYTFMFILGGDMRGVWRVFGFYAGTLALLVLGILLV